MKSTLIKQRDITDCGAACLASVAAHYRLHLPIAQIRQMAGTDKKGTNALGMVEAAEKMGFSAKGVKGGMDALPKVPLPAIAHVVVKEVLHHYVVIYRVSEKEVKVMDPAFGKIESYSLADFEKIWSGVLILLMPNEGFEQKNEKVSISSRFWFLIKPHRPVILQSITGAAIFTLIGLTSAIYVQKIIDYVLPFGNKNLLNLLSTGMLLLLVIQIVVNVYKSIFITKTGQQIDAKLILGYYRHLLNLPQRFFDTMRTGEIISRIGDAINIRTFINEVGIDLLVNVFVILFSFGLMFTYYWKLALVMLLIIPFYLLIYQLTNRFNKKVERKVMEQGAELEAQLVESLNGIRTIKAFGMQYFANLRTEVRFVRLLSVVYKSGMNSVFSGNATTFVSRAFTIVLLWVGAQFALDQTITPGELMSFYAITGYFTGPVSSLVGANKAYQNAKIAADRLFEIMDLSAEKTSEKLPLAAEEMGDIHFEEVSFRYGTRVEVFEDFALTIKAGQFTAIVGESGSGKSTIASILRRLYPLEKGRVMIGNYNLESVSESSLSKLIGVVPQQVDLFSGTVLENIALGEFEPDGQRIMNLAESIGALDFINQLPEGLNTILGENGLNLSGGQRQRIAILRALYMAPELLIFDEATASLDREAESRLLEALFKLKEAGKTIIYITHRLHTVVRADQIIVLKSGRLEGMGRHDELLSQNQVYQSLFSG